MRIKNITVLNEKKDPCWKGYQQIGMKKKGNKEVPNCVPKKESFTNEDFASLIDEILNHEIGEGVIEDLQITSGSLTNERITTSKLESMVNEALEEYYFMTEETLNEAEYKGRKVSLGKISRGDRKKYKVHVKNAKGNVVKVEFGDPNMEIKRDNPERRKNFRARHHCENPGPRWKARYWACKTWSSKPVSKMVKEDVSDIMSFDKVKNMMMKSLEQANQATNMSELQSYLTSAEHFFDVAKQELVKNYEKSADKMMNTSIGDYEKEKSGHHVMPGDIQIRESFMATRAGALGETFGEAPKLSDCCQQEIVNNDKCSHCGKKCNEMPS